MTEARSFLCVGGVKDRKTISLVTQCSRVVVPVLEETAIWAEEDEPHKEIVEGLRGISSQFYSVRRLVFPCGNFVEVLGLEGWTDYEVFKHLTSPNK